MRIQDKWWLHLHYLSQSACRRNYYSYFKRVIWCVYSIPDSKIKYCWIGCILFWRIKYYGSWINSIEFNLKPAWLILKIYAWNSNLSAFWVNCIWQVNFFIISRSSSQITWNCLKSWPLIKYCDVECMSDSWVYSVWYFYSDCCLYIIWQSIWRRQMNYFCHRIKCDVWIQSSYCWSEHV